MDASQRHKTEKVLAAVFLWALLFLFLNDVKAADIRLSSAPDEELSDLLDRVAERIMSYPEMVRWTASVRTKVMEMNKRWEPKKTVLVTKKVNIDGASRSEEILKALEIKKGGEQDITQQYRDEIQKQAEKARKREEKGKDGGVRGRKELSRDQILPFQKRQREDLEFAIKDETVFNGKPVYILESRSRIKDEDVYTGTYTIAKDSLDVLRVEIYPTKKPSVIKTLEMAFEFQILPGGYMAVKRTWFKMHLNVIIKVIRMEAEEEYSNIEVLN